MHPFLLCLAPCHPLPLLCDPACTTHCVADLLCSAIPCITLLCWSMWSLRYRARPCGHCDTELEEDVDDHGLGDAAI